MSVDVIYAIKLKNICCFVSIIKYLLSFTTTLDSETHSSMFIEMDECKSFLYRECIRRSDRKK